MIEPQVCSAGICAARTSKQAEVLLLAPAHGLPTGWEEAMITLSYDYLTNSALEFGKESGE